MIRFVLIATVFPSFAFAQNEDPRIRIVAPASGVKEQHIETVYYYRTNVDNKERTAFQVFMDLHPKHDTLIVDTVATETRYFSEMGRLDSSDFDFPFPVHLYYAYTSDTEWVCITSGKYRKDTTIVTGNFAEIKRNTIDERYWYAGDSAHFEMYNTNGKRIYRHHYCSSRSDSFWDYQSCGPFLNKIIVHGANRDTVSYMDSKGRWMVKVINHYDSAGHAVKSEYVNRTMKKFDLVPLHANHHIGDATLYLPCNGDRLSMIMTRTYDHRGLLMREAWVLPDTGFTIMQRFYTYSFY